MKYQVTILIFLTVHIVAWCQKVTFDEITIESDSTTKMVKVKVIIDEIKLDSINRIKLLGNAIAKSKNSKNFISDWFHSDDYLDNSDNQYTFVFDSIPKEVIRFEKIDGVFRYFHPSINKKSIVHISNGDTSFNTNILLQNSNEIKVIPINGLTLKKLKKRKKKLTNYVREIISKNDLDESLCVETLNIYFDYYNKFKSYNKLSDMLLFYIEKPSFEVVSINITDSYSKNRKGYYGVDISTKINNPDSAIWVCKNFGKKLESDFNIEIIFENEISVKDFEFELLNVDLR